MMCDLASSLLFHRQIKEIAALRYLSPAESTLMERMRVSNEINLRE
jgi:hypothetical protein